MGQSPVVSATEAQDTGHLMSRDSDEIFFKTAHHKAGQNSHTDIHPLEENGPPVKAIQEYIDNLSDDDKVAFLSATDFMQQGISHISSSHIFRVEKAQKGVEQFLLSFVQHSPEIPSLVVGGLNCILTVSTYSINLLIFVATYAIG